MHIFLNFVKIIYSCEFSALRLNSDSQCFLWIYMGIINKILSITHKKKFNVVTSGVCGGHTTEHQRLILLCPNVVLKRPPTSSVKVGDVPMWWNITSFDKCSKTRLQTTPEVLLLEMLNTKSVEVILKNIGSN